MKIKTKGQLSIFIILIFQTLFILFAMSLNVALVVHDKINLQNSIDIATYYGAMKQAEVMNSIAHINYQIRQSWKLLSWRYRVLGSLAITQYPPPINRNIKYSPQPFASNSNPGPYFFCTSHPKWGIWTKDLIGLPQHQEQVSSTFDDNICISMGEVIPALSIPKAAGVIGGFAGLLSGITSKTKKINKLIEKNCNKYSHNSWLFGIMSFIHFNLDQTERKHMIYQLAQLMAEGKDLDGQDIKTGVEKTFKKNLSFINKQAYDSSKQKLKIFNSVQNSEPAAWLQDYSFYSLGFYSQAIGSSGSCAKRISWITVPPPTTQAAYPKAVADFIKIISPHPTWPNCSKDKGLCATSAGITKKRNFLIFYSVKIDLKYKNQIFIPFRKKQTLTLKAKAFAKPFGGIIGPPPGADKLLPRPGNIRKNKKFLYYDKYHTPNYSRYPGDLLGLNSQEVHYNWNRNQQPQVSISNSYPINKNITYYIKNSIKNKDPLVIGKNNNTGILSRKWELVAIAPDLFDITYFTILPDYHDTYFKKIGSLLGTSFLRGDLGTYKSGNIYKNSNEGSSIKINNIRYANTIIKKSKYQITKRNLLLTGWNPVQKKYQQNNDYTDINNSYFGECNLWGQKPNLIANGCIYGGRSGYSVKMISAYFLQGFINSGQNSISNPFPEGDSEWYKP